MSQDDSHKNLYLKNSLEGHTGVVNSVAFSPNDKMVASGGYDNHIRLWDVIEGIEIKTFEGHYRSVNSVAFSPDSKILAAAGFDGSIRLYSVDTGDTIRGLKGPKDSVSSLVYSPDGKTIAACSADKTIRMWNVESGNEIKIIEGYTPTAISKIFGKIIKKENDKTGHKDCITSLAFSPDGKYLASGCLDKTIKLWSIRTGELVDTFKGHSYPVYSIAFSPDGKYLASGSSEELPQIDESRKQVPSNDKTIKLWSTTAGQVVRTINTRSYDVRSLEFSPDGELIVTGGWDYTKNRNTIRLWSVKTTEMVRPFDGHPAKIFSVDFNSNGRLLTSGGDDKMVKIWYVE